MKTEVKDSQAESDNEEFDDGKYHHSIEKPRANSDDETYDDRQCHHSIEEESMEIVGQSIERRNSGSHKGPRAHEILS